MKSITKFWIGLIIKNDNLSEDILLLKYVSNNDDEQEMENIPVTDNITSKM